MATGLNALDNCLKFSPVLFILLQAEDAKDAVQDTFSENKADKAERKTKGERQIRFFNLHLHVYSECSCCRPIPHG